DTLFVSDTAVAFRNQSGVRHRYSRCQTPDSADGERRRLDVADAGRVETAASAAVDEPRHDGAQAAVLPDGMRHPRHDHDPRVPEVTVEPGEVAEGILGVGPADEPEHGHAVAPETPARVPRRRSGELRTDRPGGRERLAGEAGEIGIRARAAPQADP